jgi:uncharacterized Zn finger protein
MVSLSFDAFRHCPRCGEETAHWRIVNDRSDEVVVSGPLPRQILVKCEQCQESHDLSQLDG